MNRDGRQYGTSLAEIRPDHRNRYELAADRVRAIGARSALDAGCGCGYGARILAGQNIDVLAIDRHRESIEHAREHFAHPRLIFAVQDVLVVPPPKLAPPMLAVAFEIIEHLRERDAELMLSGLSAAAAFLICSAPNETVVPFGPGSHPEHKRHYTENDLARLLDRTGWRVEQTWGQATKEPGAVDHDMERARTIICLAERRP